MVLVANGAYFPIQSDWGSEDLNGDGRGMPTGGGVAPQVRRESGRGKPLLGTRRGERRKIRRGSGGSVAQDKGGTALTGEL